MALLNDSGHMICAHKVQVVQITHTHTHAEQSMCMNSLSVDILRQDKQKIDGVT